MDEKWITRKKSLHASQGFQQKNNLEKCPLLLSYINTYMMTFKRNKFFRILFTISLQCNVLHCRENVSWLLNFFFSVFYSKQMATGARQCLSTGHRKQQDFLLWTLPLWTLVAQIKSSVSISGQCASCKIVSRDVSRRILRLLN